MPFKGLDSGRDHMRFHMPGHNGSDIGVTTADDVTELSFSGNLLEHEGAPAELERRAAELYGAEHALIFTSGATSAINAALLAVKQMLPQPVVIIGGTPHKSLYAYMRIHGLAYLSREEYLRKPDSLKGRDIVQFHTSPDYYGRYEKAWPIADASLMIIDASHAAHYPFGEGLPRIAADGYDIIIYSLHKTLPVLTGGALIAADGGDIYNHLSLARMRTHTTSPSFMTLKSIDMALESLAERGRSDYRRVKAAVDGFITSSPFKAYYYSDYTRLVIDLEGRGAARLNEYLEDNGCFVEMVDRDKLVLIITPRNYQCLEDLARLLKTPPELTPLESLSAIESQRDKAKNLSKIGTISFVEIDDALGRISANEIGIYPPGTPQIYAGERIGAEAIELIKANIDRIFGLVGGKLAVYDESY